MKGAHQAAIFPSPQFAMEQVLELEGLPVPGLEPFDALGPEICLHRGVRLEISQPEPPMGAQHFLLAGIQFEFPRLGHGQGKITDHALHHPGQLLPAPQAEPEMAQLVIEQRGIAHPEQVVFHAERSQRPVQSTNPFPIQKHPPLAFDADRLAVGEVHAEIGFHRGKVGPGALQHIPRPSLPARGVRHCQG